MIAWTKQGGRYTARTSGCALVVQLKDAVAAALADGFDSADEWPWLFEVTLPDDGGRLRGARETLADAQGAALLKAEENAGVPDLVWNVG
jgi:hypothetical protein